MNIMLKSRFAWMVTVGSLLFAGIPAWAQQKGTFPHEVTGGTNSVFTFSGGRTNIGFNVGYFYLIRPEYGLQVGYNTQFTYTSGDNSSVTIWPNLFGIRYNFLSGESLNNQAFIDAGIGFTLRKNSVGSNSNTDTNFLYGLGIGKRFAFAERVSYDPSFAIQKEANHDASFIVTPIAFSFFFG